MLAQIQSKPLAALQGREGYTMNAERGPWWPPAPTIAAMIKAQELVVASWHGVTAQYLSAVSVPLKSVANVELIGLGTFEGHQIELGCLGKLNGSLAVWGLFLSNVPCLFLFRSIEFHLTFRGTNLGF